MSKVIAIIPARYQSSRFPGKPLALISGKPMIQWVYESVFNVQRLSEVYVATDDERIFNTVLQFGGNPLMTSSTHQSGSDRIAECIRKLRVSDDTIILNIQGDEPLIESKTIDILIDCFDDETDMATLKTKIIDKKEILNPNIVKVVSNQKGEAIYFSRSPIPYVRSESGCAYYKHIGVYGYRAGFLLMYSSSKRSLLEITESLEQLRVIEMGYKIKIAETDIITVGVDTPEQLAEVEAIMKMRE